MSTEKEAFISSEDRPHVGINPDTPIAELKVRDLHYLLTGVNVLGIASDFKILRDSGVFKDLHDKDLSDAVLKYIRDHQYLLYGTQPIFGPGPGPEFDQVVRALSGLAEQVSQLSKEVEALKKEQR